MKKPLKLSSKTHKLLWMSDLHDFHDPKGWSTPTPYESRGFKSAQEHHDWFIAQWHKHVDHNTVVLDLGDTTFGDGDGRRFDFLSKLPCAAHYLLNGNHLSGAKLHYKNAVKNLGLDPDAYEVYPAKHNSITFVGDTLQAYVDGIPVYMQHYAPYIWPELSHAGFCLTAHSHGNCKELNPEEVRWGQIIDIGLDNAIKYNGTPFFSWDDIKTIMAKKNPIKRDHH